MLVQPSPGGVKLLCGQFAFNASAVLTGDDDGSVTVYGLQGFEQHPDDQVTAAVLLDLVSLVWFARVLHNSRPCYQDCCWHTGLVG